MRYLPLHPGTAQLVTDYLEAVGHGREPDGALLRPVKNNTGGAVAGVITAEGVYKMVKHYATRVGVNIEGSGPTHCVLRPLPARSITRPTRQGAGVARACQHRHHAALRPAEDTAGDSPTFKVRY